MKDNNTTKKNYKTLLCGGRRKSNKCIASNLHATDMQLYSFAFVIIRITEQRRMRKTKTQQLNMDAVYFFALVEP